MAFARSTGTVGQRRLQRWALILVLAWLPGITFFGHWTDLAAPVGLAPATHAHAEEQDHAAHCHTDVGTCTDAGGGAASVVTPALPSMLVAAALAVLLGVLVERAPTGFALAPVAPPPRAA